MNEENVVDLRKEREKREKAAREKAAASHVRSQDEQRTAIERVTAPKQPTKTEESQPEVGEDAPEVFLEWETLEFQPHAKDQQKWIRTTALITLPLLLILFLTKNILGMFVLLIGAVAFLVSAFRPPARLRYAIEEDGVVAGETFTPFEQILSFWIFEKTEDKVLSLKRKGLLMPYQKIPVGDAKLQDVRAVLKEFVLEEEQHPTIVDAFLRRIGY